MRLTIVHPCIGRHAGSRSYLRSWQMQPLPPAMIAGLTPPDIEIRFWDDRMEPIPFDEPTDLVAISVETYTARRAYQIASEYRRRGVPVVMGGFHAMLCPDEVARYADITVVGEAEEIWHQVIDDVRHGRWQGVYTATARPRLGTVRPDRRIFRGKRYLPLQLVESGRGCHFVCDFCAIQTAFGATQTRRPVDTILAEIREIDRPKDLYFFVDDNITSNLEEAKEFYRALAPLGIRWISQASINAAHDEEFLDLIVKSGCQGILIGFESMDRATLKAMGKGFNTMGGGYAKAMANIRRAGLRVYGTFVFGYDHDTPDSFDAAVDFAIRERLFIGAFNHLTPFPGTAVYQNLQNQGRLTSDAWWLDPDYRYNQIPFLPKTFSPEELQAHCLDARRRFYSWSSILTRIRESSNRSPASVLRLYFLMNMMLRREVGQRNHLPLGDAAWTGSLLPVDGAA